MKPVDEMTYYERQRETLERLGWRLERDDTEKVWTLLGPTKYSHRYPQTRNMTLDEAWTYVGPFFDDWYNDADAALELFGSGYLNLEYLNRQWKAHTNYLCDPGEERWITPTVGANVAHVLFEAWLLRQRKIEDLRAAGRL